MNLSTRAKRSVRTVLHRAGFDVVRYLDDSSYLRRRMRLIQDHRIDVLFDVGASVGQYGLTMRALGFAGRIISYEPSTEAFRHLEREASKDDRWRALNFALAERDDSRVLNVSGNAVSSSLLPMLTTHERADPSSAYVAKEQVQVHTLAGEIDAWTQPGERIFVKVDTQGSEGAVLAGAGERMARINGFQIELSAVPLYEGQMLIEDVISLLRRAGFAVAHVEPTFVDKTTGRTLQLDGVFLRDDV